MALICLLSFQKFYWREKRERNAPSSYLSPGTAEGLSWVRKQWQKADQQVWPRRMGKGERKLFLLPDYSKRQDSEQVSQEPPLISWPSALAVVPLLFVFLSLSLCHIGQGLLWGLLSPWLHTQFSCTFKHCLCSLFISSREKLYWRLNCPWLYSLKWPIVLWNFNTESLSVYHARFEKPRLKLPREVWLLVNLPCVSHFWSLVHYYFSLKNILYLWRLSLKITLHKISLYYQIVLI